MRGRISPGRHGAGLPRAGVELEEILGHGLTLERGLVPGRAAAALVGFIPLHLFAWKSLLGTRAAGESQKKEQWLISAEQGWSREAAGVQGEETWPEWFYVLFFNLHFRKHKSPQVIYLKNLGRV